MKHILDNQLVKDWTTEQWEDYYENIFAPFEFEHRGFNDEYIRKLFLGQRAIHFDDHESLPDYPGNPKYRIYNELMGATDQVSENIRRALELTLKLFRYRKMHRMDPAQYLTKCDLFEGVHQADKEGNSDEGNRIFSDDKAWFHYSMAYDHAATLEHAPGCCCSLCEAASGFRF